MHVAEDCWTCRMVVPPHIMGADGFILVHGAPLERETLLDPLSTMAVSRRVSGGYKVGCGWGVGIGAGLHHLAGKFKSSILYQSLAFRTMLATPHCQFSQTVKSLHLPIGLVWVASSL